MRSYLLVLILLSGLLFTMSVSGQQQSAQQNAQAVSALQTSLASLVGSNSLSDITLTGTATRTAGSDNESGTAQLRATAIGQSRLDLSFPGGNRSEVRDSSQAPPVGQWLGPSGSVQTMAQHNLMTEPAWFFPAFVLSRVLSNSNYSISAIDQQMKNGSTVNHVTVFQQLSTSNDPQGIYARLSRMDIYLDPTSNLPVAIDICTHPDNNANLNIPVELLFTNYQVARGLRVPMHVQQLVNNVVLLDIEVSQVNANTGLTSATFSLQ